MLDDEEIKLLRFIEKQVINPRARTTTKLKHKQLNYELVSIDEKYKFRLFTRQSTVIQGGFSCGLQLIMSNTALMLARYNGYDHPHVNQLDGTKFDPHCHIHELTLQYLEHGRRPEGHAEITTRYTDLDGAFNCLIADWNVTGLKSREMKDPLGNIDEDPNLSLFDS